MIRPALLLAVLTGVLAAHGAPPAELSDALKKARELATKKDFTGAMKILRTEAEHGDARAANALGEMIYAGQGVKASPADALPWFQKAADASLPEGMYNLAGVLALGGEGVQKNEIKAKFLIRAAAEAGWAAAQARMGSMAEEEAGQKPGTPDFSEAYAWYKKAADQENSIGLFALMRFTDNGFNAPPDLQKGTEYCLRAAKAGSNIAMNEMGIRYQQGHGLPQDHVAAIGWFSLAAQSGLPAALANLGRCYESGDGARQDFDIAGRNYAAASKQNYAPAQFLLAQMFEAGKGTEKNLANAYVLYTRAAAQKFQDAEKKAAEIKKQLTPAQLDEAEKRLKNGSNP